MNSDLPRLDMLQEIKKALSNWHDLEALRASPLTNQTPRAHLLAAGCDRGLAIQQLLLEAIESLRPGAGCKAPSRAWRTFHALHKRYVEDRPMAEIQKQLAISQRELYRALEKGWQAIAAFWQQAIESSPETFANLEPIPRLARFVGREKERAFFRQSLAEKHLAVICGMPGVGKTSLGAELVADRDPDRVLWIKFIRGCNTTLESLLDDFARALAARGQPDYLLFLQSERGKLHPLSLHSHTHYLVGLLTSPLTPSPAPPPQAGEGKGGGYTLCLDDHHLVDDDPLITAFCTDLWYAALAGQIDLIVMSRTSQHFAREWDFPLLKGMSLNEVRQLLAGEGMNLSGRALDTIYAKTSGSPMFLKLFAAWIKEVEGETLNEARVAERAAQMESGEALQAYLLSEVESTLPPGAVRVAIYAAALRTALPMRDSDLLKMLATKGVADAGMAFYALQHRHLATLQANYTLAFHPLVKAYFYARLAEQADEKEGVHWQLASYWERRREWTEAIYHHLEAGEAKTAAQVLGERVDEIINAGLARAALELVGQVGDLSYQAYMAVGRLRALIGEYTEAIQAYTQALRCCTEVEQWAQIHRLLGDVCYKQAEYDQALAHYGEGMALLGELTLEDASTAKGVELARLQHSAAQAYRVQGKYAPALDLCEQSLRALGAAGRVAELAQAYSTLSVIHSEQGNYARALLMARESLALAERQGNTRKVAEALYYLAIPMQGQGDYPHALAHLERALELARQVGDVALTAGVLNVLGIVHFQQEHWAPAAACLQESLAVKEKLGAQGGVSVTLNNLGIVYSKQANYPAALEHLEKALSGHQAVGRQYGVANVSINLAEVHYGLGHFDEAIDLGLRSLVICRESGYAWSKALALEVVGRACLARGKPAAALEHLLEAARVGEQAGAGTLAEINLTLAETRLTLGERDEAQRLAEIALELAGRLGSPWLQGRTCRVLGEIEKAEEFLRRSVALLEEAGVPFELGKAYRSLGLFLRGAGRAEEGCAYLEKAREVFEHIGARWELERTLAVIGEAAQK